MQSSRLERIYKTIQFTQIIFQLISEITGDSKETYTHERRSSLTTGIYFGKKSYHKTPISGSCRSNNIESSMDNLFRWFSGQYLRPRKCQLNHTNVRHSIQLTREQKSGISYQSQYALGSQDSSIRSERQTRFCKYSTVIGLSLSTFSCSILLLISRI